MKIILFIALTLVTSFASAQKADTVLNRFYKSVLTNLNYPKLLIDNCTPTLTMIKVDIDAKGLIQEMKLSDSADLLFIVEFTSNIDKIDRSLLQEYVRLKSLKNTSVLIPFTFFLATKDCPSPNFKLSRLDHLFYFNKELFRDSTHILPPLTFIGERSSIN